MADKEDAVDRLLSMIAPWTWVCTTCCTWLCKDNTCRDDMHQYVKVYTEIYIYDISELNVFGSVYVYIQVW